MCRRPAPFTFRVDVLIRKEDTILYQPLNASSKLRSVPLCGEWSTLAASGALQVQPLDRWGPRAS